GPGFAKLEEGGRWPLASRQRKHTDLAYQVSPEFIEHIAARLEDISPQELTGITLLLQDKTHWLFLSCSSNRVADQVRMRMREFFDVHAMEIPGKTLEDVLAEGFDRIIPGNAFPVWRESGWEGGLTQQEAYEKVRQMTQEAEGS